MTGREFYDAVQAEDELTWLGVQEGGPGEADCVVVQSRVLHDSKHAIPIAEIQRCPEQVLDCLMGRQMFQTMIHLTRIVGYYSRVNNWNRSKLAELKDRQKGFYTPKEIGSTEAKTLERVA